ncbi:GNAT family N-acetyltransferase [Chromatium okenii]|uniref:GNAT family N-acetyltransferase n=1 Tax=Chromatium okenii TaxID=61644 RepID=UPI0026ECA5B4|nr:GNAT family N-acetyltransferase [Chromatium okenii]MBV5310713.1 GNAT family N-acetyltransferase [Chromatium okenii]
MFAQLSSTFSNTPADLSHQAQQLLNDHEKRSFDLGFDWLKLLVEVALDVDDHIRIYLVNENSDNAQLILPLKHKTRSQNLFALTTFYTSLYSPAVIQINAIQIMVSCFSAIRHEIPAWHSLRLQPLARDTEYTQIKTALRQAGWLTFEFFCFGNWYLPISTTNYDAIFANFSSRVKSTLKRKHKQFLTHGNGHLTIVTRDKHLEQFIQDYVHVYASSWKKPEPYPEFIPALIRLCARRGWLRLGLAYINGEVAAAQIWIVCYGRAAIYKLAYDARFEHYSVGTLLTDHLMRHVIEVDQVKEIDYLIGDDPYKRDWMTHRRERWGLIAYNPRTISGLFGAMKQFTVDSAKKLYFWLKRN